MKNMLKVLRNNRGDMAIDESIKILVFFVLMVLAVTTFSVFNKTAVLNSMSHELVRYIELRGMIDDAVYGEMERLEKASGLTCDLTIDGDYIGSTKKIQFGDSIDVKLKSVAHIGAGGVVSLPVTITSHAEGRSERYWK